MDIWLLQDGEVLPIDEEPRLMRTGILAERLVNSGSSVTWWTSKFNHFLKTQRKYSKTIYLIRKNYKLYLLGGNSGYKKNISFSRILYYRKIAHLFLALSDSCPKPDLILASYPSPELCYAGSVYAKKHGVPIIVDIRDPWPDIFPQYFHFSFRWITYPFLYYYKRLFRLILSESKAITAVSKTMLRWAHNIAGVQRNADRVFYIGYDPPDFLREIKIPDAFTEENPLICVFVSTGGRSYDGLTIVETSRVLEKQGEKRIKFIITGSGEMHHIWMKKAGGLKTITFTGWISHNELQMLLQRAHIGLIIMKGGITKFWLGNKFAEYLSAFLTIITNVEGEVSEIVKEHQIGRVIPSRNPEKIAQVLKTLVNSPYQVKQYMENSKKLFFEFFDRRKIYDDFVLYLYQQYEESKRRLSGD